jgi:NIMA (never in mitosis gene a)-related kinase 1/4/5
MLKKYKKVKYLGQGSYGAAILVSLKSNRDEQFVIKEIVIGHMKESEQLLTQNEVDVLKQMHHSNIAMYVESFVENSKLYIVMEYADGGDLSAAIQRKKKSNEFWNEDEVMRIFVQICLALKHVHDRNIIHRDLKSQNIFLTTKGIVKLGDFGIAKVLDSTGGQARTQIGTPYYLSPEICDNTLYDTSSDIWSLGLAILIHSAVPSLISSIPSVVPGVVLYELLCLELPFTAQSLPALVVKICSSDPSWIKIETSYSLQILDLVSLLSPPPVTWIDTANDDEESKEASISERNCDLSLCHLSHQQTLLPHSQDGQGWC